MIKIIVPLEETENRFGIFLAGPIQGARDWQAEAINLITAKTTDFTKDFFIASPRTKEFHKGYDFEAQIDWESRYLMCAGINGVIMFWLCNESEHFCNRAFAQTTRFELAEWITITSAQQSKGATNVPKIVVGFDTNFSGTKYIKHRLKYSGIPLCNSLEETVDKTIELLKQCPSHLYG